MIAYLKKRLVRFVRNTLGLPEILQHNRQMLKHTRGLLDQRTFEALERRQDRHPNPLTKNNRFFGFAQNDEDSITLEILRRIGLTSGRFVEFGVGNGLENNSIILLASGWSGWWFGGQDLAIDPSTSKTLEFKKTWITKENVASLYRESGGNADVISLDLDGNDIHFVRELLESGATPSLFIVEYHGKFPPGVRFEMPYDPDHSWKGDDYYGASLQSFKDLFEAHDYRLVCCNIIGLNAFFVKTRFDDAFPDVPRDTESLFVEPYYFTRTTKFHRTSPRTVQAIIDAN